MGGDGQNWCEKLTATGGREGSGLSFFYHHFRGPELVDRLELVYVLSYLVFLFELFSFISVLFSFNYLITTNY